MCDGKLIIFNSVQSQSAPARALTPRGDEEEGFEIFSVLCVEGGLTLSIVTDNCLTITMTFNSTDHEEGHTS